MDQRSTRFSTDEFSPDELATFGIDQDEPGRERPGFSANGATKKHGHEMLLPIPAGHLIRDYPHPREPLFDGLIRRGETANIIAPPKVGKSWLANLIALSKTQGRELFGQFPCQPGRVLLIDNELHPGTLASRLRTVAAAMGIAQEFYEDQLAVLPLRGKLMDLPHIAEVLGHLEPGEYDLVILDAWYRALPRGVDENKNGDVAQLYNLIDGVAARLDCAWLNIHHASKGNQSEKAVVDVGAGAGSQSRAADAHLVLRPHEADGAVVLEAVSRSFAPIAPIGLRWEFPLWVPDTGLDATKLRGRLTKAAQQKQDDDKRDKDLLLAALLKEPLTCTKLMGVIAAGRPRTQRLLSKLVYDKEVASQDTTGNGGEQTIYRIAEGGT